MSVVGVSGIYTDHRGLEHPAIVSQQTSGSSVNLLVWYQGSTEAVFVTGVLTQMQPGMGVHTFTPQPPDRFL